MGGPPVTTTSQASGTADAVPVDLPATRRALDSAVRRAAALVASIERMDRPADPLEWSVGETATHMLVGLRAYTDSVLGRLEGWRDVIPDTPAYRERMAFMTSRTIALEPRREPAALSALLTEVCAGFLEASSGRSASEELATPWYGPGHRLPLDAATCLLLGEALIHGRDIARALRRPWDLSRHEALLILPAMLRMMPLTLDRQAAGHVRARFLVRMRGGPAFALHLHGGTVDVGAWDGRGGRADCRLWADPVAFILLGYGRVSQWPLIARGRILAYGRRPWLALGLRRLFVNP